MIKWSHSYLDSPDLAREILREIHQEDVSLWPHGLDPAAFDSGLWVVTVDKIPAGFVGFQIRLERDTPGGRLIRTGYYSVGVLRKFRRNGVARQALGQMLSEKAQEVERVRALVKSHNSASIGLANSLNISIKFASSWW